MTTDIQLTYTNRASIDSEDYSIVVFLEPQKSKNRATAVAWQVIQNVGWNGSYKFNYPHSTSVQATWDGGRSGTPRREVRNSSFALEETESGFQLLEEQASATPTQFYVTNRVVTPSAITAVALKAGQPIMIRSHLGKGQKANFSLSSKLCWAVVPNEIGVGEVLDLENFDYQQVDLLAQNEISITLVGNLEEGYRFNFSSESSDTDSFPELDSYEDSQSLDKSERSPTPEYLSNPNTIARELKRSMAPAPTQLLVEDTHHQDLFPFVYMRPWPQISSDDRVNFIEYLPQAKLVDSLYSNLLRQSNESDAREIMHQSAVDFINGDHFISSLDTLSGLLGNFSQLYIWLKQHPEITWSGLKSYIQSFDSSWQETVEYLDSENYQDEKDRVWQNFFALMIALDEKIDLLETIIKTLVVANLLEELVDSESEERNEINQQDYSIRAYLEATIILPKEIFPLPPRTQVLPPNNPEDLVKPNVASNWVKPYAIGELNIVRQRLLRYEVGEISHIENILRGEKKQATKRRLNRINSSIKESNHKFEKKSKLSTIQFP